jgi:hypothetical protein
VIFWKLERKGVEKVIFGGHKLSYVFNVVYKLCYFVFIGFIYFAKLWFYKPEMICI